MGRQHLFFRSALKLELDMALDEALDAEARANEVLVAWVRLGVLVLVNIVGLVTHPAMAQMNWGGGLQGCLMLVWLVMAMVIRAAVGRGPTPRRCTSPRRRRCWGWRGWWPG